MGPTKPVFSEFNLGDAIVIDCSHFFFITFDNNGIYRFFDSLFYVRQPRNQQVLHNDQDIHVVWYLGIDG
jgi:hypothetical protein